MLLKKKIPKYVIDNIDIFSDSDREMKKNKKTLSVVTIVMICSNLASF